jgi:hypothetical protein
MNDINLTQADSAVHPYEYAQERGLTKREYFAALAMQGMMANNRDGSSQLFAELSVKMADALIKALNQ